MVLPIVRFSKFVGTIGLGLLTGVSYSLSTIALPSLLHLQTAALASQTHSYIRSRSRVIQRWLSTITAGAFVAAFFLAPRRSRHPYLIYTAVLVGLGSSPRLVDKIATKISRSKSSRPTLNERLARRESELAESGVMVGQSSSSDDEEDVNGEVVRNAVEKNQLVETIRTGFWGLGFLFSVVGIWGDGL